MYPKDSLKRYILSAVSLIIFLISLFSKKIKEEEREKKQKENDGSVGIPISVLVSVQRAIFCLQRMKQ